MGPGVGWSWLAGPGPAAADAVGHSGHLTGADGTALAKKTQTQNVANDN